MTTFGALIGLLLSILLIMKKVPPVYGLMAGAIAGGVLGGLTLPETVSVMIDGAKDVSPAVIRILSAGILSGVLIETGAASVISNAIIHKIGEKQVFISLALATFLLCAVGVFVDVSVITVAPVALMIHKRLNLPISALLVAMIGGGKAGNIISPNPNTIIVAENFHTDLSSIMLYGLLPATIGVVVTVVMAKWMSRKSGGTLGGLDLASGQDEKLPSLWSSLVPPVVTIGLLALRPMAGIVIDPLIALPIGGLVGLLAMRRVKNTVYVMKAGLQKMAPVAVLLIGTGTIAGVIRNSDITQMILSALESLNLNDVWVAPLSGSLMSAATASTTAGAMLSSVSFADVILSAGIPAVWGALMVNAGCTVLDHLPHGSFFHATGGVCGFSFKERLVLVPFETAIGASLALGSTLFYYLFTII